MRFARGKWIALLDDDDEWFPEKLEKQRELGCSLGGRYAFVASRFIERTEAAERVFREECRRPARYSANIYSRGGDGSPGKVFCRPRRGLFLAI